ncbi:hypothetical protein WA026_008144 [Henosepilachna vigintioctopunctata]|uniref:Uncharacterized protein n=1 Tax=Henosepilachna vigintioctopunctata TaxID=420089 RepID=A0AAW1TIL6_9CUCU
MCQSVMFFLSPGKETELIVIIASVVRFSLVQIRRLQIRDLGVVFDQKLSFVPHITQLISSAAKIYGFVIRNGKYFNNSSIFIEPFNTLIRSKLEYGSMIWHPIYTCHQHHLEAIQRRFLKFLIWRKDKVYPRRGVNS